MPQSLSLKDVIDIKEWQRIQENFASVTHIGIVTVDPEGNYITVPSGRPRLFCEIFEAYQQKHKTTYKPFMPRFLGGKGAMDRNLSFVCEAGLHNYVLPMKVNGSKILGYIIIGPAILVMRKAKEEYRVSAERLGVELEEFWSALLEIKVISFHGMQSLVDLVRDISDYILRTAYSIKELMAGPDSSRMSRTLDNLLDVAFEVSGADIGSIMFLDDEHKYLTIKASRGLSDEIISDTKVKLGDGLSGMAAKEGKSILIDKDTADSRIKAQLNRPNLSTSMILPIRAGERVMGVMNLGALKNSPIKLSSSCERVVTKLINLVTQMM